MKKALLSISCLLIGSVSAISQTTATNFTASDCSAVSHTLFTELDAGKVVVLSWVMPCATCISNPKAAYDAAQSFSTSNPGKVLYWLADDLGNITCASLTSWATTNSIGPANTAIFSNTGNVIKETDFGGTGMPHVVVMGGAGHQIFYNNKNGSNDGAAITTAINQALAAATNVVDIESSGTGISLYPNPAKNNISVDYHLNGESVVSIEIYNVIGSKVCTADIGKQSAGTHTADIDFGKKLAPGVYLLKLSTDGASQSMRFNIAD